MVRSQRTEVCFCSGQSGAGTRGGSSLPLLECRPSGPALVPAAPCAGLHARPVSDGALLPPLRSCGQSCPTVGKRPSLTDCAAGWRRGGGGTAVGPARPSGAVQGWTPGERPR